MKLTFVSNYINHHQIPVSNELHHALGMDYCFIQTEPMEEERLHMGWEVDRNSLPYLMLSYEQPEECRRIIMDSDIVVFGGTEDESYIAPRLETGRPVIRYSERIYREGQWKFISPRGLKKKYQDHIRYRNSPVYLLCSGAYVASDFSLIHAYPGKMFCWGYFPQMYQREVDLILATKGYKQGFTRVPEYLYVSRLMELKHPEYPLELARALKDKQIAFHMTMIGQGELEARIRGLIDKYKLQDCLELKPFMEPARVREAMDKANVFLMTSDQREGWGAVIPEAMNSGCTVIANAKIGAVPYLLRHGRNGLVYRDGNKDEFISLGIDMALQPHHCMRMGRMAYSTVMDQWNPQRAAAALLELAEGILKGELPDIAKGPCSPAPIISPSQGYDYARRYNR